MEYKTKDLYLASLLYAEGQTLERVEREGGICWFVFAERESSELLANAYWSGKAVCNARAYADAIRRLKDRVFSEI